MDNKCRHTIQHANILACYASWLCLWLMAAHRHASAFLWYLPCVDHLSGAVPMEVPSSALFSIRSYQRWARCQVNVLRSFSITVSIIHMYQIMCPDWHSPIVDSRNYNKCGGSHACCQHASSGMGSLRSNCRYNADVPERARCPQVTCYTVAGL